VQVLAFSRFDTKIDERAAEQEKVHDSKKRL